MSVDQIIHAGDVAEARIAVRTLTKREVMSAWIRATAAKVPAVAAVFEKEIHIRDGVKKFDNGRTA